MMEQAWRIRIHNADGIDPRVLTVPPAGIELNTERKRCSERKGKARNVTADRRDGIRVAEDEG